MARQPEIRLGRIRMPRATSPFDEVQRAQNRFQVASDVMQIGKQVGEIKSAYDVGDASATTAAMMGAFEREYSGKEMYTPDEIREMGLDSLVPVEENGTERQYIPAHEVYPIALQRAGEEAIRAGQGKITNARTRQAWANEMNAKQREVVNSAIDQARGNAYRYTVNTMSREAGELQESGLFLAAEEKIRAMPIPDDQKRPLLLENARKQEVDLYNRAMVTEDPEQLQLVADDLAQNMDEGKLLMSDADAKNLYFAANSKRNAAYAERVRQRKAAGDAMATGIVAEMATTGTLSDDVIELLQDERALRLMGKENMKWVMGEADRVQRGDVVQTSTYNQNWFELQMSEILAGNYGSYISQGSGKFDQNIGTYAQALNDLESWIKENAAGRDPITGQATGMISGSDMRAWLDRIQTEREMPSTQNEAYKAAVTDLRQRLYGTDGGVLSQVVSVETGSIFANAVGELREAVRQDPQYDITNWQKTRMPTYLSESAREALIGLTGQYEDLDSFIQYTPGDTFGVDGEATKQALMEAVRTPPVGSTREEMEDAVLLYESWSRGVGADYVN